MDRRGLFRRMFAAAAAWIVGRDMTHPRSAAERLAPPGADFVDPIREIEEDDDGCDFSAPCGPKPGMLWIDSSDGKLRRRSSDNQRWETVSDRGILYLTWTPGFAYLDTKAGRWVPFDPYDGRTRAEGGRVYRRVGDPGEWVEAVFVDELPGAHPRRVRLSSLIALSL